MTPLSAVVKKLERRYGAPDPPFPTDPFALIVWENIAYLADDRRRRQAFDALRTSIGTEPRKILGASSEQLRAVTSHGILADTSVEKLTVAAQLAVAEYGGDLDAVVRRPLPQAMKALRRFPGIGEPGAEKILLFAGLHPFLAPDSNALRVLVRLGLVPERSGYAATYAEARALGEAQLGRDIGRAQAAHQLLRRHGQETCRRAAPGCAGCVLRSSCAYAAAHAATP